LVAQAATAIVAARIIAAMAARLGEGFMSIFLAGS
jgi:hypothetical protein